MKVLEKEEDSRLITENHINNSWEQSNRVFIILLICIFAFILLRHAWICDDAYITFRTVDNFINGYRLNWNITERVQVYTHPLWMFFISLFYSITREIYFTSLILTFAISLFGIILFARKVALSQAAASIGILGLLLSKAYVDYSTSGLENALSHLLIIVFCIVLLSEKFNNKTLFSLSLISSLAILNRMDLALVIFPAIIYGLIKVRTKAGVYAVLIGQLPFILWEIFAIFYYGFPFPNTAYAKLNTGIPSGELVQQGFIYLLNSIRFDPITLMMIATGLVVSWIIIDDRIKLIAVGTTLYLIYVVIIGGDFMSGRFLTVPLICAVIIIARCDFNKMASTSLIVVYALMLLLGFSVSNPTFRINDLGAINSGPIHVGDNGILDERMLYYGGTGLLNVQRNIEMPYFYWGIDGERARVTNKQVVDRYGIGLFGFYAGPNVYVLDRLALADPLLARLPAKRSVDWRIGHFKREVPEGYVDSLILKKNKIADPELATYYDKLSIIIKGNLFDPKRLVEIWKMNTGQYDHLIGVEKYRYPEMVKVDISEVSEYIPNMTSCDDDGVIILSSSGIEIGLNALSHASWMQISLDHNDKYEIVYLRDQEQVATQNIPTAYFPEPGGIASRIIFIPKKVSSQGFNLMRVFPLAGEKKFCLGHVRLLESKD